MSRLPCDSEIFKVKSFPVSYNNDCVLRPIPTCENVRVLRAEATCPFLGSPLRQASRDECKGRATNSDQEDTPVPGFHDRYCSNDELDECHDQTAPVYLSGHVSARRRSWFCSVRKPICRGPSVWVWGPVYPLSCFIACSAGARRASFPALFPQQGSSRTHSPEASGQ